MSSLNNLSEIPTTSLPDHKAHVGMLPAHMHGGMLRYIEHGIEPGGFLYAVLTNDFMGACGKADDENRASLFAYAQYLHNHAPANCFGSEATVHQWMKRGGLQGPQAAQETP